MRKISAIAACMALTVCTAGCATLNEAKIGKAMCANPITSRTLLNLKIAEDGKIKDDALRTAALSLDDAALAVLNACPVQGPPPVAPPAG